MEQRPQSIYRCVYKYIMCSIQLISYVCAVVILRHTENVYIHRSSFCGTTTSPRSTHILHSHLVLGRITDHHLLRFCHRGKDPWLSLFSTVGANAQVHLCPGPKVLVEMLTQRFFQTENRWLFQLANNEPNWPMFSPGQINQLAFFSAGSALNRPTKPRMGSAGASVCRVCMQSSRSESDRHKLIKLYSQLRSSESFEIGLDWRHLRMS